MDSFIQMVNIQSVLFIYLLVGYYCRRTDIISDKSLSNFIDLIVKILLPCMIFNSFNSVFSKEKGKLIILCLVIAFGVCFVSIILGKFLYNFCSDKEKPILQYGTLVSNSGFAGLPMIASACGDEALFFASFYIIPQRIFMWSAGISLFTVASFKTKFKSVMLNPCVIAVELGIIKMIFALELPSFLATATNALGDCSSSLSMVVVGAILGSVELKTVVNRKVLYLVFIRQFLLPMSLLLILKSLNIHSQITFIAVVLTGMPVGSTTAILAKKYGADYEFASKCVFTSTVLSLITVPILTLFL